MPGRTTRGFSETEYRRLLENFPPRPIRDAVQLQTTEDQIDALLTRPKRTRAEDEYLDLLSDLVRDWEIEHVDIPPVSGIELVKFLCEQHGLSQRALVPVFGTASIVSEVLAGRRALQAKHIDALANLFHVSPAAFFPIAAKRPPSEGKPAAAR